MSKTTLKDLKLLCDKYGVTKSGSKSELADRLSSLRGEYLSNAERKKILPYLPNNKNKDILKDLIKENYRQTLPNTGRKKRKKTKRKKRKKKRRKKTRKKKS
jgi:hypothetical protein